MSSGKPAGQAKSFSHEEHEVHRENLHDFSLPFFVPRLEAPTFGCAFVAKWY
jgi:hypothetical protein